MTSDMIIVLSSFLSQSKKKKYGPRLTNKLIASLRYVAKAYPLSLHLEDFSIIFCYLSNFLTLSKLTTQYVTIDTLSYAFDSDWIRSTEHPMLSLKTFQCKLFEKLKISAQMETLEGESENAVADIDRSSRLISVHTQLLCAIICRNNILRKEAWFLLAELCFKKELSKGIYFFVHYVQKLQVLFFFQNVQHVSLY